MFRMSQIGDEPKLHKLWRETFGDEDSFISSFFSAFYTAGNAAVAEYNGEIISAMYLLPAGTLYSNESAFSCCYLYALSTLEEYRCRGIAEKVLECAAQAAFSRGYDCVYLSPAENDLFAYYEKRGFESCFSCSEQMFLGKPAASPVMLESVSPEEYSQIREELLENIPHVEYSLGMISFQQYICKIGGAELWRFPGGCVAAEVLRGGKSAIIKELLCDRENIPAVVSAVMQMLGCGLVQCRFPDIGENTRKIALARFNGKSQNGGAWVPFAFD